MSKVTKADLLNQYIEACVNILIYNKKQNYNIGGVHIGPLDTQMQDLLTIFRSHRETVVFITNLATNEQAEEFERALDKFISTLDLRD